MVIYQIKCLPNYKIHRYIHHQKENPGALIPSKTKYNDYNLGQWIGHQRTGYKKGILSEERIQRLEKAGFVWDELEEAWEKGYRAFVTYQKENPGALIPRKTKCNDYNLGSWVNDQRTDYKKGILSEERIQRLEKAGIVWDPLEELWEEKYRAFVTYQKENPGALIRRKTKYNDYNLGRWVHDQRTGYKKGILSDERIQRLEKAGIDWENSP